MTIGVNSDEPFKQNTSQAEQRQVIRTKTLGRTEGDVQNSEYKKIAKRILRQEQEQEKKSDDDQATEIKNKILDRASERRHLKYEVIDDADIVQISVINSGDGTVIRKVPPDKIVSFIRKVKEENSKRNNKIDIRA
ncbi:MAG: flagellar protein FlaG [Synergistaceae bacterium]|nr:flagellar protein FlaG [Synergistaceae bacterium]